MDQKEDKSEIFVLSLWSWPEQVGAEAFYDLIKSVIDELGANPTDGFMSSDNWPKMKELRAENIYKRMNENTEKLVWFGLGEVKNRGKGVSRSQVYDKFFIEAKCRTLQRSFQMGFEDGDEFRNPLYLSSIVRRVSEIVSPCYGFATRIPQYYYPLFFLAGVGEGHTGARWRPERETRTRDWGGDITAGNHCRDRIRDLFEYNYLNADHLSSQFRHGGRNITFGDFIRNSGIGSLTEVTSDLWCWSVPTDRIPMIRPVLMGAQKLVVTV